MTIQNRTVARLFSVAALSLLSSMAMANEAELNMFPEVSGPTLTRAAVHAETLRASAAGEIDNVETRVFKEIPGSTVLTRKQVRDALDMAIRAGQLPKVQG